MCMAYGEMEIQMICDTRLGEKILVFNIVFDSFDLVFLLSCRLECFSELSHCRERGVVVANQCDFQDFLLDLFSLSLSAG